MMSDKMLLMSDLRVSEHDGTIYLGDERIVLTSSAAFGALRKDLAENIGHDRMKGFLLRYGWNLGANDAKRVIEKGGRSIAEMLKQGPVFHGLKGYTKAKTMIFQIDYTSNQQVASVHVEGIWHCSPMKRKSICCNMGLKNRRSAIH